MSKRPRPANPGDLVWDDVRDQYGECLAITSVWCIYEDDTDHDQWAVPLEDVWLHEPDRTEP